METSIQQDRKKHFLSSKLCPELVGTGEISKTSPAVSGDLNIVSVGVIDVTFVVDSDSVAIVKVGEVALVVVVVVVVEEMEDGFNDGFDDCVP